LTLTAAPESLPDDVAARWPLVLPHEERLRRIAARRLGCKDEVDDVVQEAMLRAVTFERLDPAYVGQFLTTVTVRLCADVQRDRVRQLRVGVRDALRTVDPADPTDTLLDLAEARWLYDECLKLSPREFAVVFARANGMSVKEAALTLGVGTKSAEAALTKARHRMRRAAQSASVAVLGLLRRARYAGTPAAVAAGVTVVTVAGVVGGIVLSSDPPRPQAAAPVAGGLVRDGAAPVAAVPAADPVGTVRQVVRTVAPPVVVPPKPPAVVTPPDKPEVETPPLGDPNLAGTREGVRVEQQYEEESFEESVQRCVQEILSVDPFSPLCDPEE
jgi:RNA polymerase sigma-70 factor (ECF subfamily)